jgi:RNA polymerase sigma-70 factor (ECF subfamily)
MKSDGRDGRSLELVIGRRARCLERRRRSDDPDFRAVIRAAGICVAVVRTGQSTTGLMSSMRPVLSFRASRSDLHGLADEDLMAHVRDGDQRAFEVVFDRHADAAFSLAYRMCGRRATAEDIVQESFLSLWRSGGRYDPSRGSVRSWVLGVVHNRAIDLFRRETVRTGKDVSDDDAVQRLASGDSTEHEVERRADAAQVHGALHELPDEQRKVIELAYYGGFSHSQIAQILDLPAGTVKGRMRLALTQLRISLDEPSGAMS